MRREEITRTEARKASELLTRYLNQQSHRRARSNKPAARLKATASILGQGCTLGVILSSPTGKGRSRFWHYTDAARTLVIENGLRPYTDHKLDLPEYLQLKNQPDITPGKFPTWRRKNHLIMWGLWKLGNKPSTLQDLRELFNVDTAGLLDLVAVSSIKNLSAHLISETKHTKLPLIFNEKDLVEPEQDERNRYWLSAAGVKFIEEHGDAVWASVGKKVPTVKIPRKVTRAKVGLEQKSEKASHEF